VRIAAFGAGALGSYYGALLASGGAEVSLIARGAQLAGLREHGVRVVEPERTTEQRLLATGDPAQVGPVDVVLFCVKSYDTEAAAAQLGPLLHAGTAVLSLQNGIDNEDKIGAAVGREHVAGAAAYLTAAVHEPGVVSVGGPRRLIFGEWEPGQPSVRMQALLEALQRANVQAELSRDVRVAKWEKFTFLAAVSAMTAAVRLGVGEIRDAPAAQAMLRELMTEVAAVGRRIGIALSADLVDRQMAIVAGLAPDATASLYHDLVTGHRMEIEALQGAVLRLGREHDVPTPAMAAAYAILQPWAIRNEQTAS
jgi:2-dehydropantoate 2-reductase